MRARTWSRKTTFAGVLVAIGTVLQGAGELLGDGFQAGDIIQILLQAAAAFGLLSARDDNVTSERTQIPR